MLIGKSNNPKQATAGRADQMQIFADKQSARSFYLSFKK